MALKPWKILESKHIHKNVRLDRCELPDGKTIEGFVLEYQDWVTVLALTRDRQVVMVRQYRHGARKVIEELPGGAMDAQDASPLDAACRELLEETGYASDRLIQIGKVSPNPANQTNLIHSFLALDAEKVGSQHLDETEEIEVLLKPLEEVIRMAKDGELLQTMQVSTVFFALAYLDRIC
ncbi:MAG TPA: NUDIX hydrolase [Anaerolineales bacterium]|nr:NUDIX hydrolase [Anaerolineales bacterium]